MNNLSIDLRPRKLEEVIGHDAVKAAIKKQIDSGSIPRAFMFSGPAGLGKTTLALIVGRLVQGSDFPTDEPFEIIEHNAADLNGVEDVRELVRACEYRPFSGHYRVVVLNEAQQLTGPAQNCLLQPFEAEHGSTVFILTTTDPAKVIQPLQDRCKHFKLKPLSAEAEVAELVESAARHLDIEYPSQQTSEFIAHVVNSKIGSPRQILQAFEKLVSGVPLNDCFTTDLHEPLYRDVALAVVKGDWNGCRSLLAQIQTADSRALRSIVSGYLRTALIKAEPGTKAAALANCLVGLGASSFEDGLAYSSTVGLFYKTCAAITAGGK